MRPHPRIFLSLWPYALTTSNLRIGKSISNISRLIKCHYFIDLERPLPAHELICFWPYFFLPMNAASPPGLETPLRLDNSPLSLANLPPPPGDIDLATSHSP